MVYLQNGGMASLVRFGPEESGDKRRSGFFKNIGIGSGEGKLLRRAGSRTRYLHHPRKKRGRRGALRNGLVYEGEPGLALSVTGGRLLSLFRHGFRSMRNGFIDSWLGCGEWLEIYSGPLVAKMVSGGVASRK